jgi:hypothetical protein
MEQEVLLAGGIWDLVIVRSRAGSRGGWRLLLRWYQAFATNERSVLVRTAADQGNSGTGRRG